MLKMGLFMQNVACHGSDLTQENVAPINQPERPVIVHESERPVKVHEPEPSMQVALRQQPPTQGLLIRKEMNLKMAQYMP